MKLKTMQKSVINQPEMQLIGISCNTSYTNEFNPASSKIRTLVETYWNEQIAEKIPHRLQPGITVVAYFDYESDEYGNYSYLMGEIVSSIQTIPAGMTKLILPAAKYCRLTTETGTMPQVIIQAWQQIWKMWPAELGGKRTYHVDYEIYDKRAKDLHNTSVDIFLGIA